MTLKTRLDEAVGTLEGDAQLLHQVVHGGDQMTVVTEGGPVKTVAHVIRQTSLELDASRQELTEQVATATLQASAVDGSTPAPQRRQVLCGGNGYLSQHETTLHFGLGAATGASSITVQWPAGGGTRTLLNLAEGLSWTAYSDARLGDLQGDGRT